MRCKKAERWISERLDGSLPAEKSEPLLAHLAGCPSCRAYQANLESIQAAASRSSAPGPGPEYFARSVAGLRARLRAENAAAPVIDHHAPAFFPRGRWAWTGAASLLIVAAGLFVVLSRTPTVAEIDALEYTEPLAAIDHQFADNPDMEADLDSAIRISLAGPADSGRSEIEHLVSDHALLVDSLTDEEVRALDEAIRLEISRRTPSAKGRLS
jgi:hypothetical protein